MSDLPAAPEAAPLPDAPARSPEAAGSRLKLLFPALFGGAARPIKLRIQADIEARAPGQFTRAALTGFLRRHTGTTAYLKALVQAQQRFDLDGQAAGELSEEHREAARKALAERRDRLRARDEEMAAARLWRQGLLVDWQQTKLNRASFCALKGVDETALEALLAQAQAERQLAPPPATTRSPGDRHRGPAGPGAPGAPRGRPPRR